MNALLIAALLFTMIPSQPEARPDVLYGVYRHDKWFSDNPPLGFVLDDYTERLPFFSCPLDGHEAVYENRQSVMDEEIQIAAAAGIDFWAFFLYPNTDWKGMTSYNYGLNGYLNSPYKSRLHFALVLPAKHIVLNGFAPYYLNYVTKLVQDEQYQREPQNKRPILFIYQPERLQDTFGAQAVEAVNSLRAVVKLASGKNPYLIAMIDDPQTDRAIVTSLGFDAVTGYTAPGSYKIAPGQPYSNLEQSNRNFWNALAGTGKQVLPIVNTGWDGRPLVDVYPDKAEYYNNNWYEQALPWQIEHNTRQALDWMDAHPGKTITRTVMFYAWNENAEGGWLLPTENNYRLNRLSETLGGALYYPGVQ